MQLVPPLLADAPQPEDSLDTSNRATYMTFCDL